MRIMCHMCAGYIRRTRARLQRAFLSKHACARAHVSVLYGITDGRFHAPRSLVFNVTHTHVMLLLYCCKYAYCVWESVCVCGLGFYEVI